MAGRRGSVSTLSPVTRAERSRQQRLEEDNISLIYQVRKLHTALASSPSPAHARVRSRARSDTDDSDSDDGGSHDATLRREVVRLRGMLRGAQDYIDRLEKDRARLQTEVDDLRAAAANDAAPRSAQKPRLLRERNANGSTVRDALATAFLDAQDGLDGASPAPRRRAKPSRSGGPTGGGDAGREARGRAPASAPNPLALNPEQVRYLLDEVLSLKDQATRTETAIAETELGSPSDAPRGTEGRALRRELRQMKSSQKSLMHQVRSQQQMLLEIAKVVSESQTVFSEDEGKQGGGKENRHAKGGRRRSDERRHHHPPGGAGSGDSDQTLWAEPVSAHVPGNGSWRDDTEDRRREQPTRRIWARRPSASSQRRASMATDTKFALLSAGFSAAYADDQHYVRRASVVQPTSQALRRAAWD